MIFIMISSDITKILYFRSLDQDREHVGHVHAVEIIDERVDEKLCVGPLLSSSFLLFNT